MLAGVQYDAISYATSVLPLDKHLNSYYKLCKVTDCSWGFLRFVVVFI
jgi:hypothetical protein